MIVSSQVSQRYNKAFGTGKLPLLPLLGLFIVVSFLYHHAAFQQGGCRTVTGTTEHVEVSSHDQRIAFRGFNGELIPSNSILDVNIGTNDSPFGPMADRHRILVDPLFYICDNNAKLTKDVTAFCFAVSNYTGFATFYEYNQGTGVSSSLSKVGEGTTHENFPILSKRTVLVLEAMLLFSAIHEKQSTIHRLKLDMQGHELSTLRNIQGLLRDTNLVTHIMAECFCPNQDGKQIYEVDNSCEKISDVLQGAGYNTKWSNCPMGAEWGDIQAYKKGSAYDFLPEREFDSVSGQYLRG
jgi:FkbM family methyltransferase